MRSLLSQYNAIAAVPSVGYSDEYSRRHAAVTVAAAEIEVRVIIEYMVSCCRFSGAAKASVAPPVAHPGPRLPLPCCTAVVDVRLISRNSQATKRSVGGAAAAARPPMPKPSLPHSLCRRAHAQAFVLPPPLS